LKSESEEITNKMNLNKIIACTGLTWDL